VSLMTLHCPECREDRLFERPHPAAERHDSAAEGRDAQCHDPAEYPAEYPAGHPDGDRGSGEGTELACVECGTAVFAGFALPIMVGTAEHTRSRRHPPGRAA
jgi:hypothetical protein